MKKATLLLIVCLARGGLAASGGDTPWHWRPSLLPRAFLVEGLWSDTFRLRAACHAAGLPYDAGYRARLIKFDGLKGVPATADALADYAVIVLSNVDAKALGDERLGLIESFVVKGGGLVVLGGYWAYGGGAYSGTPLDRLLPVEIPEKQAIAHVPEGAVLACGPDRDWGVSVSFADRPCGYFVHRLTPRPGAAVRLVAAELPVLVTQDYGDGRVVACALTANGEAPAGQRAFWDWQEWPALLGAAVDWAAAKRPLAGAPERVDEVAVLAPVDLLLDEQALPPEAFRQLCERASTDTADTLFDYWVSRPEAATGDDLSAVVEALVPFAGPRWSERLHGFLNQTLITERDRAPALVLLGACGKRSDEPLLLRALDDPKTAAAAARGLGLGGFAQGLPVLQDAHRDAVRAAESEQCPGHIDPESFASQHAAVAAHAAQALYLLGDANGVPWVSGMYGRLHYYRRVFRNSCKMPRWDDDVRHRWAHGKRLERLLACLQDGAGPVPSSQIASFVSFAAAVDDAVEVRWVLSAMERSKDAYGAETWRPLCHARDGIVARLASVLARPPLERRPYMGDGK